MAGTMDFRLLGPLAVRRDGLAVSVPRGSQRVVLAVLLLNNGRPVPGNRLAEILWGTRPPPTARVSLQNHVKRLRDALGAEGRERIRTLPGGYMIRADAPEVDVLRARDLVGTAQSAAHNGDWEACASHASAALLQWRGEPLADVVSDALSQQELPQLLELRLQAQEARLTAELRLGRHADALPELMRLTAQHPLREHLAALLMRGLCESGRRAEALAVYRNARRALVDEIGIEPSAELRDLHQEVLASRRAPSPSARDDGPSAAGALAEVATAPVQALPVPHQLPAVAGHFVGRESALRTLSDAAGQCGPNQCAAVITAVVGAPGVGKSALASYWAHQASTRFPDGQFYVNLRGYATERALCPIDVLTVFLHALGVSDRDVPSDAQERAARYRSLLSGRSVLVVLDNARDARQVRPLVPGTGSCLVLVTSRDRLAGLVARDGATRVELDDLPLGEAVALLRALLGRRASAEPEAVARLAECCDRSPLALRVAAEVAIAHPDTSLGALAAELTDGGRRLELLSARGDPETAVRVTFSWSYRLLTPEAARAFRRLGRAPRVDLDHWAVAALCAVSPDTARRLLDELASAHLVQDRGPCRTGMDSLLHDYARERADAEDAEPERHTVLEALFDYYDRTAAAAVSTLNPAAGGRRRRLSAGAATAPVSSAASARAWLDAESANLVEMITYARTHDWPEYTVALSATVDDYVRLRGRQFPGFAHHCLPARIRAEAAP